MVKLTIEPQPEKRLTPDQLSSRSGKDFVYHKSSQPLYRLKILLKNLETIPEIYVNQVKKHVYNIPKLVHFLNLLEKANNGVVQIHGGAVVNPKNQCGIIITGWSDMGKSTSVLKLAEKGFGILGDDRVLLNSNGKISRMQSHAGIYPHSDNLKNLNISSKDRVAARLKYYLSRNNVIQKILSPNLKVDYKKMGQVYDNAQIKRIYILEKGNPEIYKYDFQRAINKIITTSATLWRLRGFPLYIFERYCFANGIKPSYLLDKAEDILKSTLKDVEILGIKGNNFNDFVDAIVEYESKN